MRFTLDACELEPGTKLVVFERLTRDGVLIASHEDLNDTGQTVSVFPPALQTHAADSQDGDSCVAADLHAHVVDTVSYKGLKAGREYTLEATLVDKRTGQPILDPFDRPSPPRTCSRPSSKAEYRRELRLRRSTSRHRRRPSSSRNSIAMDAILRVTLT